MLDNLKGVHFDKPSLQFKLGDRVIINLGGPRSEITDDARRVLDRFQQLLDYHNLNRSQLLKLVPPDWGWTLGTLAEPDSTLMALTPDRLAWIANLFGIEQRWLEGADGRIAYWPNGYKNPDRTTERLSDMNWLGDDLRMTILSDRYQSGTDGSLNHYVVIFSYPLAEWDNGETTIYRHLCHEGSVMSWSHKPCQIDTMSIAHWFHTKANPHGWIPIVPVKYKDIEAIAHGQALPGPLIPWGLGGYDQFQDRLL